MKTSMKQLKVFQQWAKIIFEKDNYGAWWGKYYASFTISPIKLL